MEDDVKLTRENVTSASRVMLPVYIFVFGWLGAAYLGGDQEELLKTPALNYLDNILDLRVWGLLSLIVAALIAAALITNHRRLMMFVLLFAMICCGIWTVVFVRAAVVTTAPPSSGAWTFLGTAACFASYRSVSREERGR